MKRYTELEIRSGLTQLALCNGNAQQAAKRLQAAGTTIPARTLKGWEHRHVDKLDEIRADLVPRIHAAIATENEALARQAINVEANLLTDIEEARKDKALKDLPAALRNVAVTKGIALDKVLPMRGQPTAIVEHQGADALLRRLQARLGSIDSTAEEITGREPAELPPAA